MSSHKSKVLGPRELLLLGILNGVPAGSNPKGKGREIKFYPFGNDISVAPIPLSQPIAGQGHYSSRPNLTKADSSVPYSDTSETRPFISRLRGFNYQLHNRAKTNPNVPQADDMGVPSDPVPHLEPGSHFVPSDPLPLPTASASDESGTFNDSDPVPHLEPGNSFVASKEAASGSSSDPTCDANTQDTPGCDSEPSFEDEQDDCSEYSDEYDDGFGSTDGYGLAGFVDAHTRMAFQGRNRLKGGRNIQAIRYSCWGYHARNNYFQW
ncbi:hypothetical protein FA15DRAFT_740553 [Coprinopsis marcescibilis]|uniref:Uncharacterized protein n=1 Tax=Coprinopsis marcescibilis TaxID=230819 RepID=A0A5C3L8X6_COPMA|nr:hypothetical protein FA15DRAFT_740553 [Coprinopsis marcescibilis]